MPTGCSDQRILVFSTALSVGPITSEARPNCPNAPIMTVSGTGQSAITVPAGASATAASAFAI